MTLDSLKSSNIQFFVMSDMMLLFLPVLGSLKLRQKVFVYLSLLN